MRKITINGRLGGDPEMLQTKNGVPYVVFRIANSEISDKDKTYWFRVTVWDKTTQNFVMNKEFVKKGTHLMVYGDYSDNIYQSKVTGQYEIGREIVARDINFAPGGTGKSSEVNENTTTVATQVAAQPVKPVVTQEPVLNPYTPQYTQTAPVLQTNHTVTNTESAMPVDDELPF